MKSKVLGLLAVGLLVGPLAANAAPMLHTYRIEFSGIETGFMGGGAVPSELQTMAATLTVNFDPVFSSGLTPVTSLVFDSAYQNSLFGPGYLFRYDTTVAPNLMTIGDHCLGDPQLLCTFSLSLNDLIINFMFTEAGVPFSAGIVFRVDNADYRSTSSTVQEGTGTSVPEPGTLALLGLGLASLGLSRRRRSN